MKHAVIICNGNLSLTKANLNTLIANANLLIAVDAGLKYFSKFNINPDIILGDMDSISPNILNKYKDNNKIKKILTLHLKDQTDTELAIIQALNIGAKKITIIAGTGKRVDHTIGNIELLKKYPNIITLMENNTKILVLNNKKKLILKNNYKNFNNKKNIVSLFSINNPKITTTNLKYNLNNQELIFPTHGVSNKIALNPASISINSGLLIVCANINIDLEIKNK